MPIGILAALAKQVRSKLLTEFHADMEKNSANSNLAKVCFDRHERRLQQLEKKMMKDQYQTLKHLFSSVEHSQLHSHLT